MAGLSPSPAILRCISSLLHSLQTLDVSTATGLTATAGAKCDLLLLLREIHLSYATTMKWEQAYASLADPSLSLPRFGHSAVASTDSNGSAQVVIYGGVGTHAGETAQTALGGETSDSCSRLNTHPTAASNSTPTPAALLSAPTAQMCQSCRSTAAPGQQQTYSRDPPRGLAPSTALSRWRVAGPACCCLAGTS
jgi:hypothetical protein